MNKKESNASSMDALTDFVDRLSDPAPTFQTLEDFNASPAIEALKWKDLEQDTVYQILSARSVNIQHGQSIIQSLQEADGSCYGAWACGMLTKELLQNPMMSNSRLFVRPAGSKTSKNGMKYNSYQLLQC